MEIVAAEEEARVLIDALPYLDTEYDDPGVQAAVRSLIEHEMAGMAPRDYLAHLPAPEGLLSFPENPVLAAEMRRMAQGQRMAPLDVARCARERDEAFVLVFPMSPWLFGNVHQPLHRSRPRGTNRPDTRCRRRPRSSPATHRLGGQPSATRTLSSSTNTTASPTSNSSKSE